MRLTVAPNLTCMARKGPPARDLLRIHARYTPALNSSGSTIETSRVGLDR